MKSPLIEPAVILEGEHITQDLRVRIRISRRERGNVNVNIEDMVCSKKDLLEMSELFLALSEAM